MLFPMLNGLHFYISVFRYMCAVPNTAVFCSSLISCFPGMLLRYFLDDFEMAVYYYYFARRAADANFVYSDTDI
jgi:hypothetical protein